MQICDFFLNYVFVNFYSKDSKKKNTIKGLWIKKEELSLN
jgi:hypothetical protein